MITKPLNSQELNDLIDTWKLPMLGRFGCGSIEYKEDGSTVSAINCNGGEELTIAIGIYQSYLDSKGLKPCTTK